MTTMASIGNQAYAFSQGIYSTGANAATSCGKAFCAFSKEAANNEFVLTVAKAVNAFSELREVYGFGPAGLSEFKAQVNFLDGLNSLMTLPETLKDTVLKIKDLIAKGSYSLVADVISATAGLVNTTIEAVSYLEHQLAVPALKGMTSMIESVALPSAAVGAGVRSIVAVEKIATYIAGKTVNLTGFFNNVLDLTKNGSDVASAALKLTNGSQVAITTASAVSAFSRVAQQVLKAS